VDMGAFVFELGIGRSAIAQIVMLLECGSYRDWATPVGAARRYGIGVTPLLVDVAAVAADVTGTDLSTSLESAEIGRVVTHVIRVALGERSRCHIRAVVPIVSPQGVGGEDARPERRGIGEDRSCVVIRGEHVAELHRAPTALQAGECLA